MSADPTHSELQIVPLPALDTNYIWVFHDRREGFVVDPGEAGPVIDYFQTQGLRLTGILLTHHHHDHIGGVSALTRRWPVPCWGSEDNRMPAGTRPLGEGDTLVTPGPEIEFQVMEVPAHTRSHLAFVTDGAVLTGDTLFSVGCGRLFEGEPAQMHRALNRLAELDGATRVYCGHEYTVDNCRFALQVEPDNRDLQERLGQAETAIREGRPTLPSTIASERRCNPFMRVDQPQVISAAREREPGCAGDPAAVLGVIRRWKDRQ